MSFGSRAYKTEHAKFETTRWSVVLLAGQAGNPGQRKALEMLCQIYRYPIYAFILRRGVSAADAEDVTQDFFLRFIDGSFLKNVGQDKGRFRSYLRACCQHFLLNVFERANAQKRGGQFQHVELTEVENQLAANRSDSDAEVSYDRDWARELFRRVHEALGQDYRASGKGEQWDILHPWLHQSDQLPSAELASRLGVEISHFRVLLHRLRERYREMVQSEVASTLDDPAELKDEIRYLLKQLR